MENAVTKREKISYGLYFMGQNVFYGLIGYMTTYFTDIGITAALVAIVALITKVWDAINDPIFGMIMDKVNFKKGKFLPWLRISVIAIPVATILLFIIPTGISMMAKIIWATLAYMLWDTAYTLCDVPIFGIVTTMTIDQKERVSLNSIGRMFAIGEINEFQRDDGSVGYARSAKFSDGEGRVGLTFWDQKAKQEYKTGGAYKIENAKVRLGMYEVELNIGGSARVIELPEDSDQARFLPSFKTIETMLYSHKSIADVEEDDEGIIVTGRIIESSDVREFDRTDGSKGYVKSLEIADNSGSINVTLWNENAKKEWNVGDAIKFQDPQISFRNDSLEINVSRSTSILEPDESEIDDLPTYDELKESIYVPKTIEALEDDDRNVRITGTLKEVFGNKILITKCPSCGNTVDQSSDDFVCSFCGEPIDEPRYLLMVPARLEDDTGEISITFFDNLAEELLDMKKEDIINLTDNGSDLGPMEGRIDDLNGLTVEVITNVSFDDYNEEIRLNPKRILSKYY